MRRLYMVGVRGVDFGRHDVFRMEFSRTQQMDIAMSRLGEWLRYNAETWLVLTDVSVEEISERVRPIVNLHDSVIVLPIDGDAAFAGWAPQSVWDIIQKRSTVAPTGSLEGYRVSPPRGSLGNLLRDSQFSGEKK